MYSNCYVICQVVNFNKIQKIQWNEMTNYYHASGHFFYIETSSPRQPGDVALLESPDYPASIAKQCFAFFYHMLGKHIGEFNVYIKHGSDNDLVFSKNETQGDMWHKAQIQLLPMAKTYQVILQFSFILTLHTAQCSYKSGKIVIESFEISIGSLNASSFFQF